MRPLNFEGKKAFSLVAQVTTSMEGYPVHPRGVGFKNGEFKNELSVDIGGTDFYYGGDELENLIVKWIKTTFPEEITAAEEQAEKNRLDRIEKAKGRVRKFLANHTESPVTVTVELTQQYGKKCSIEICCATQDLQDKLIEKVREFTTSKEATPHALNLD